VRHRWVGILCALTGICAAWWACAQDARATRSSELSAQWERYAAAIPKSIVDLQPFRQASSAALEASGGMPRRATLINLNPAVNAWFLLELEGPQGETRAYHLGNPSPERQRLELDPAVGGVRLVGRQQSTSCALWNGPLEDARRSSLPDAPLCAGQLYLRNQVPGTYTNLERVTNFLRDHVWGGEKLVTLVREELFKDAFIEHGEAVKAPPGAPPAGGPEAAAVDRDFQGVDIQPVHLGIGLPVPEMELGRWYEVSDNPGVYLSAMQPRAVERRILSGFKDAVNTLDPIEGEALAYLVAFDLSRFEIGFELGTDHPRVGWSDRTLPSMRNERLPGPDGIDRVSPLVLNGIVSPALVARTVAAFAGGFKREHGAFRYGALALRNSGSHYGFMEQGTIFSKLQPGLATLLVGADGRVEMKTWSEADDARLGNLRHARQNGVPLIESDDAHGVRPGALVNEWGPGNWSGSSEEELRTLRAGACLQERGADRFLVYGYFSTATPSAMARVFQAYHCSYAMHLDMNALEHTYLALYSAQGGRIVVEHLIEGMEVVDRKGGGELAPRFLAFPDDRDFFYVYRKEGEP